MKCRNLQRGVAALKAMKMLMSSCVTMRKCMARAVVKRVCMPESTSMVGSERVFCGASQSKTILPSTYHEPRGKHTLSNFLRSLVQ